ncbi:mono-functional DNA-alkylating methyl methanesulfonate N-term-domain-containing protein [Microdochium bolleyi]|uniref:Mono-functional DNA-alkylating methyl methanesulfonate N-term-domain-containing protein n=1 Tax=Microdochium bolleyi TaxID=196109 RepID=A0A136J5B1_9PEZI|nr:mono-functional DNA-alkylating methyl methanesulfonate N-term-domain-containing protein [Microdochium bolleyi]
MVRNAFGQWAFETSYWRLPRSERQPLPLAHLTVDPRSRYLCFGHTESMFVICELESMDTLRKRHSRGLSLEPVKDMYPRAVRGQIGNISFLYPPVDADSHVILLIIMIQETATKIAYYDWEHGHEKVSEVFRSERSGLKLVEQFRLPLMVVPLTVRSAFIIVTEGASATISGLLEGSLNYDTFDLVSQDPTNFHHGKSHPLCVAWTRPVREAQFHETQDVIYLVREDGIINFLEVGIESGIETSLEMGEVDCNFDTAFACMYDRFSDVLLAGGDSGPGAMWSILPRAKLQPIKKIPNWAPMIDLTVMQYDHNWDRHKNGGSGTQDLRLGSRQSAIRSDRLFACSGKGRSGVITEFRQGLQARIGLEMTYPTVVRQCYVVTSSHPMAHDSILLLLALPDSSAVLRIPESGDESACELSEVDVAWDLASRTLAFIEHDETSIQVTTQSVTVAANTSWHRSHISDLLNETGASIAHASIYEDSIVLAVRSGSLQKLVVLHSTGADLTVNSTHDVIDEITCLSLVKLDNELVAVAGIWHSRRVQLVLFPVAPSSSLGAAQIILPLQALSADALPGTESNLCSSSIEPLTSIVPLSHESNPFFVAAGTRSGEVLTIRVQPGSHHVNLQKFGMTAAHVSCLSPPEDPIAIMVTNDEGPVVMTKFRHIRSGGQFKQICRVWPTAVGDANFPSIPITGVVRLPSRPSESREKMHLIMVSGSQIMYSELHTQPEPLMRQFATDGTPTKVRYDASCDALVTAVVREGRSVLCLFDPETGAEISEPLALVSSGPDSRKQARPCEQIDGLSSRASRDPAVRITCLDAWNIRQDHHSWPHLLLGCRTEPRDQGGDSKGLLLVVKVENVARNIPDTGRRRIPILRKFACKFSAPVYAITSHDQGVFVCFGNVVQYLKIDPTVKKLKEAKSFELPSLARSLHVKGDKLHVVTVAHSLMILDYTDDALGVEHMVLLHSDEMSRQSLDVIDVGSFLAQERRQSVAMLSDWSCGVHGLWSTSQEDSPLIPLFQAEMRASIIKFGRANTRAPWDSFRRPLKFGSLPSGKDGSDIVGISIDGALHHFTLINEHAWRLLRFIQNLAMAAPAACSYRNPPIGFNVYGPEPQPGRKLMKHVDGDILQQCLDSQAIEVLVADREHSARLQQLLRQLMESESQQGHRDDVLADDYDDEGDGVVDFELVYEILEYYLCPVY